MITFLTGVPGAGKTAYAITLMLDYIKQGRPIYSAGIPDLNLPHTPVPPVAEWTTRRPHPDDPSILVDTFTFAPNSVIFLDECQNFYRVRAASSKVPPHVAAFETHRHLGIDFVLLTQRPHQVDLHVRGLVGKHIHLRSGWQGRDLLEWSEAVDPSSITVRDMAVKRKYTLPKHVFGLYKSAEVHTKHSRRLPKSVFVVVIGVVLLGYLGVRVWDRLNQFIEPTPVANQTPASPPVLDHRDPVITSTPPASTPASVLGTKVADYLPRLHHRPETAPLYDGIRQVRVMPVVAGCVSQGDRCVCFTQQGTDAFLSTEECQAWIDRPAFNPYREPAGQGAMTLPPPASSGPSALPHA